MMLSTTVPQLATASRSLLTVGDMPVGFAEVFGEWAKHAGLSVDGIQPAEFTRTALHARRPALIALAGVSGCNESRRILHTLKRDSRLQTVPTIVVTDADDICAAWLNDGADDVVAAGSDPAHILARLAAAMRRSRRDLQVNPSTGLVGADAISAAITARMDSGAPFAACYADLDHFKEFNDRYGYAMGDDVIRTIAALLVEVVEQVTGADGFVGHIGGDDFLFLVPLEFVAPTCEELVRRADEILSMRYSAHDRQAGYFFGKDRRGRLDRVPLMTLSIGVVTNERRRFANAAQVSELATEMKTYAKTLPGSVWAMDRRSDGELPYIPEEKHQ